MKEKTITIIVAAAVNDAIGKDNDLIWSWPNDLKRFKRLTSGHCIIMGRKTFDSFPGLLPNRKHIVISRNKNNSFPEKVTVVDNFEDALKETDDDDIKKLLKKMVKQRAESIDIYKKNNRTDLLEVEQNEYDILTSFLPNQLSEEETKKICADVISKIGANSLKDMGKVMGELKKTHADEIDFSKAGSMINELLNK